MKKIKSSNFYLKKFIVDYLPTIVIGGYYVFYLWTLTINRAENILLIGLISVSFGILSILFINKIRKNDIKYFLFCFFMLFFVFLSSAFVGNRSIKSISLVMIGFLIAIIPLKNRLNIKITVFTFIIYTSYFLFEIIAGNDPNLIFFGYSRNTISSLMLMQCIFVYISYIQNKQDIPIIFALLTLLFSIWGVGRNGVVSSLILFCFVVLNRLLNKGFSTRKLFIISGLFFLFLFLFYFLYNDFLLPILDRFMYEGISEKGRSLIWNNYISNMDLKAFIWGERTEGNYIFARWDYNLHNSFLGLHSVSGIFGVILLGFITIQKCTKYIKIKNWNYLAFLIVIYIRILTDTHAFFSFFDPVIFYLLFNKDDRIILDKKS